MAKKSGANHILPSVIFCFLFFFFGCPGHSISRCYLFCAGLYMWSMFPICMLYYYKKVYINFIFWSLNTLSNLLWYSLHSFQLVNYVLILNCDCLKLWLWFVLVICVCLLNLLWFESLFLNLPLLFNVYFSTLRKRCHISVISLRLFICLYVYC